MLCSDGLRMVLDNHHKIVGLVTSKLVSYIKGIGIEIDGELAIDGAKVHDLAKLKFPNEIEGDGDCHSREGFNVLLNWGIRPDVAKFAYTHQHPKDAPSLEHIIVCLADRLWRSGGLDHLMGYLVVHLFRLSKRPWDDAIKILNYCNILSRNSMSWLEFQKNNISHERMPCCIFE